MNSEHPRRHRAPPRSGSRRRRDAKKGSVPPTRLVTIAAAGPVWGPEGGGECRAATELEGVVDSDRRNSRTTVRRGLSAAESNQLLGGFASVPPGRSMKKARGGEMTIASRLREVSRSLHAALARCRRGTFVFLAVFSVALTAGKTVRAQIAGVACPPEPGTVIRQNSPSEGFFTLELPGFPNLEPDVLLRGDVATEATVGDDGTVQTEIVAMSLTGSHPQLGQVTLAQSAERTRRSLGQLVELTSVIGPDGTPMCVGQSFFDVFFDIAVQGGEVQIPRLHNPQPLRVVGRQPVPLRHVVPFELVQVGGQVVVADDQNQPLGFVNNTQHGVRPGKRFKRGDANCDGCVDRADAEYLNEFLFAGGPAPCCMDAADANDDGGLDIDDSVYILNYAEEGGPAPPAPGPDACGEDPTADALPEGVYPADLCDRDCRPPSCYPPAGVDTMNSTLLHDIDIPGIGLCRANLAGPVVVRRSDPYVDPASGLQCIDTQITDLLLQGVDPVCGRICITLDPCFPSTGRICEKVPGTCFPANSYFDVRIKVELKDLGLCLYACVPARMACMIDAIPPFRCLYNLNVGAGDAIPLYRGPCDITDCAAEHPCNQSPLPPPAAFIVKAVHQPLPPDECTCFPDAGTDSMQTTLFHQIDLPGLGLNCSEFSGPIVVERSDPFLSDGRCYIRTQIVRLEMTGTCDDGTVARVTLCPDMPSRGFICQMDPAAGCFPALSCFQVFFQIEVVGSDGTVHRFKNCDPAIMCCPISQLPPIGCQYGLQPELPPDLPGDILQWMTPQVVAVDVAGAGGGGFQIPLYEHVPGARHPCRQNPRPNPAGFLTSATHVVEDPNEPCCPEYGPGRDVMFTSLLHDIDIPGVGRCAANLRGPMVVERGTPYLDPLTGLCCVETRVVDLQLRGIDPLCGEICITLDPRRPSRGRICAKEPNTCFPANSCFDMWVRIELKTLGMVLVACQPARMCCMIDAIPPIGCTYQIDLGPGLDPVPLYQDVAGADICAIDPPPDPRAFIIQAVHQPQPPCDCFPDAGDDVMQTELSHRVRLFGLGPNGGDLFCDADMRGPITVARGDPFIDPTTGLCCIDTRVVEMRLEGVDPICGPMIVTLCPDRPSTGRICAKEPDTCFPANSFFDMHVQIELPALGVVMKNCSPVRMECMIDRLPPFNCVYQLNLTAVPLYRPEDCAQLPSADIQPIGVIERARHVPRELCDGCPEYGPGVDTMDSTLAHRIDVFGIAVCDTPLVGRVVVERGLPYIDENGLCCVSTRVRELVAEGVDPRCGPIRITLCPDRPSRGFICQKPENGADQCFPANSCFDIFVRIEIPQLGLVLKNCEPARMCCMIDRLPPWGCNYQFALTRNLQFFDEGECDNPDARPVAQLIVATHTPTPCPPLRVVCTVAQDPAGGVAPVTVSWASDPNCDPCERVIVTRTDEAGNTTTVTLPGSASSFTENVDVAALCAAGADADGDGVVELEYCVRCVIGGVAGRAVCCRVALECPPTVCDVANVNCDLDGADALVVTWDLPANCDCDAIVVACFEAGAAAPFATQTLPAGATSARLVVPLAQLCANDADGVLDIRCCVACQSAGAISKPQCCDIRVPCPATPCDVRNVVCDPLGDTGQVVVAWELPAVGCQCDRIRVVCIAEDGTVIDTQLLPGGTTSFTGTVPVDELCRAGADANNDGVLEVEYCVSCVLGGVASKPVCCDARFPCPRRPCPVPNVRCLPHPALANAGLVTWELPADCDCDEFVVRCLDEAGNVLATGAVAGDQTRFEFDIPLDVLCDADLDGVVNIRCCVACRVGNETGPEACCTLSVPCPPTVCDPEGVRCTFVDGVITVFWTPSPDCECDRFVVRCLLDDGTVIGETVVAGAVVDGVGPVRFPISPDRIRELCANDADGVLNIRCCVVCVSGDLSSKPVCCSIEIPCPPTPCDVENVVCRYDEANGVAVVTWSLPDDPRCRCDNIIVTCIDEAGEATRFVLPGDTTVFRHDVPLDELCRGDEDGVINLRYCVQCSLGTAADPQLTKPVCCDLSIECPGCEVGAVTCDVSVSANAVTVVWDTANCECDEFVVRCLDSAGNVLFEQAVPGGQNSLTHQLPADVLARLCEGRDVQSIRLRYCVQCVLRGQVGKPRCCDVEIPCPPRGGGQVPCDINQDGNFDIGDAVALFGILFTGREAPCDGGAGYELLADANGDGGVDISDGVYKLQFLFLGGPPPVLSRDGLCVVIPDCPEVCTP